MKNLTSDLPQLVRKFVYDHFVEYSRAPHFEEIITKFKITKKKLIETLDTLEQHRSLIRITGTQRILMAWPFSNIPTSYQTKLEKGKSYYANCAWDSIGIHVLLQLPVKIKAYCFHCADPIILTLQNEQILEKIPKDVLIHFSKPIAKWYDNIIDTCSNNMNFFSSPDHLKEWKTENSINTGYTITFPQIINMSKLFYKNRLKVDYERPNIKEITTFFKSIGLKGNFWNIHPKH